MPSAIKDQPGSICLVANDLDHVVRNSGIGTYYSLMAPLLASAGWRVHVLYLGYTDDPHELARAPKILRRQGVSFSLLSDFETPEMLRVRTIHACHGEHEPGKGIRILQALEELHRVYHFDLIEFPDWLAFGFRTIQARRTGRCLDSARLCVKLHATSAWQRDGNHKWPEDPGEISIDYRERYAFENADVRMSPSRYMLDYVAQQGWKVDDAVVAYPIPAPVISAPRTDDRAPTEVVFFGRLEIRKGLELFLDAVNDLPAGVKVTFLGRDTILPSGEKATDHIAKCMRGRPFTIIRNLMREQALRYLASENCVSVIASLSETFGFTVAECAVNGLPFLAARAGGTSEVIADPEVQEGLFFQPNSRDLKRSLNDYFKMSPERRRALRIGAQKAVDPKRRNGQMIAVYNDILNQHRQKTTSILSLSMSAANLETPGPARAIAAREFGALDHEHDSCEECVIGPLTQDRDAAPLTFVMRAPLVTIAVAYYNLGLYLPATLEALDTQTYRQIEVIVIDDGSTCPMSVRIFNELREQYPHFQFISQKNAGPGVARNRALAEARGEYFIPVDADNLPIPTMVERFVDGMIRNPELSALACFLKAFNNEEGIDAGLSEFVYMPTGGPFVLSCFENVYGDTNAMFRTDDFRNAGGFETDPTTYIEDWETFVRLAASGLKLDVIPDVLFHYRLRGDNRSLAMSRNRSDVYPVVKRMIERRFFPLSDLTALDTEMLWLSIAAFGNRRFHDAGVAAVQLEKKQLDNTMLPLRYRLADKLNTGLKWITPIHKICKLILSLFSGRTRPSREPAIAAAENANDAVILSPPDQNLSSGVSSRAA